MRVVSMVPSWTETLIEAGVEVVGRTRYCIHPKGRVESIPIVGGTKDINWDAVIEANPDMILFDKEENLAETIEECEFNHFITHVTSLASLQKEFERLGDLFQNHQLIEWSLELYDILQKPALKWSMRHIPGVMEYLPMKRGKEFQDIVYVIWKKPWMAISSATFIGSMLENLGARVHFTDVEDKYPVFEPQEALSSYYLFSSEPYPFHKKQEELRREGFAGAIVNGEGFSWFGIRALRFLKAQHAQHSLPEIPEDLG